MTLIRGIALAVGLLTIAARAHAVPPAKPADLVLRGGAIYTSNAARSWVSAAAIAGRRIVYAGDDRGVAAFIGRSSRVLELRGRMVLPGFHDSHVHPMTGGLRFLRCNLGSVNAEAADSAILACAETSKASNGGWLIGGGARLEHFAGAGSPRAKLDVMAPGRPVLFSSEDGFTAWVSSRALELAGIDEKTAAPANGAIDLERGELKNDAVLLVRKKLPTPSAAEYREGLRRFSLAAHKLGITSVIDANVSAAALEVYRSVDRANELQLRVRAAQAIDPARGAEQVSELVTRRDRARGARLRADSAKLFVDGDLEHHTSALLAPYTDRPSSRGDLKVDQERLNAIVAKLDAEGFQVHLHTSGDRAIRAGLDAIESAIAANGPRERRHQLAHVELLDAADLPRFRRLGVAADLQLFWAAEDPVSSAIVKAAFGAERYSRLHPVASIFAGGAVVVAGSDWPSPVMSPLEAMQIALTRMHAPNERAKLADLIAAYTIAGAWIAGEETFDGSIEVGKAADLVILEKNIFEVEPNELGQVRVMATLLDGAAVHCDESLSSILRSFR